MADKQATKRKLSSIQPAATPTPVSRIRTGIPENLTTLTWKLHPSTGEWIVQPQRVKQVYLRGSPSPKHRTPPQSAVSLKSSRTNVPKGVVIQARKSSGQARSAKSIQARNKERRSDRKIKEDQAERYLRVYPSSISEHAGLGLYAARDMPKATRLPYPYPGKTIEDYDALTQFLFDLVEKYDDNRPINSKEVQKDLTALKTMYGITVNVAVQDRKSWKWIATEPNKETTINWENLYKNLMAYAFELTSGENLYWYMYSHEGELMFDAYDLRNSLLLVNEPPPYNFINLLSKRKQTNTVNVVAKEVNGKLYYETIEPISQNDELLICYGPHYDPIRKAHRYSINMSSQNGCGQARFQQLFPVSDEPDIVEFYNQIANYEPEPTLYHRPGEQDESSTHEKKGGRRRTRRRTRRSNRT